MKKLLFLLLFVPMISFSQEKFLTCVGISDKQVVASVGSIFSENRYCGIEFAPPIFDTDGYSNIQYGYLLKNNVLLIGDAGVFYQSISKQTKFNIGIEMGTFYKKYYGSLVISNNYYGLKLGIKL